MPFEKSNRVKNPSQLTTRYDKIDASLIKSFADFPLSLPTLKGLKAEKYTIPTEIQKESIGLALRGLDVLGAAITGSGKTLAFIIPILERLYVNNWTQLDGLGALVISPTRELALQTYDVLRKVGCKHDFSAALIIGGTDVEFQKERISRSNIIVCTPGRILQHMDENSMFSCDALQILVLDEADRMLDMGFKEQLNAVLQNLPTSRQTLLFSATQTKSVKDLARLSLKDPVYVSVHEHAQYSTPALLKQTYMVCEEHEKINLLWSFLRSHLHTRIIIFFTNCKQVRFVYEAFRSLRPGLTVMALHGSMNQMKRVTVYEDFCHKKHAALFATDVAARGLDFPNVDWVYQFDCPQDATEYIHRSGRTARCSKEGQALLILTPNQEKGMIEELRLRKVPIRRISVNHSKLFSIQKKLEIICAKDTNMKLFAQRAFVAYMRSMVTMSNKDVFNVESIDFEALAKSFGLVTAPRVRFLRKMHQVKHGDQPKPFSIDDDENEGDSGPIDDFLVPKLRTEADSPFNIDPLNNRPSTSEDKEARSDQTTVNEQSVASKRSKKLTKSKLAAKLLRKNIRINKKVVFGDDEDEQITEMGNNTANQKDDGAKPALYDIEEARRRMQEEDRIDRENYRQKIKAKHREKRLAKKTPKTKTAEESDEENVVLDKSDEDGSIDLDWIPDFDKIQSEQDSNAVDNSIDGRTEHDKRKSEEESGGKRKKRKIKRGKEVDEELALALLDQ